MLAAPDKNPSVVKPTTEYVVLTGNPNCGKTTLFNALTGLRAKVGNYAGVTVERKEGRLQGPSGRQYAVLDLPGAYSLNASSLDEAVTFAKELSDANPSGGSYEIRPVGVYSPVAPTI